MLCMFMVFTVWFYYDAEFGYRGKNEAFFTERAFHQAVADFSRLDARGELTADSWRAHASTQRVAFPDEEGILPRTLELPLGWPEILHDYEKVRTLNPALLWREYTALRGMNIDLPEDYYSARKIFEQWVVFWICLLLTFGTSCFFVRTMRRSICVDEVGIKGASGRHVAFEDLTLLDMRKWDTKGIAYLEYDSATGSGRMRLDGLTYGGFRSEEDQPAERMMEKLRANFSGEVLEYTTVGHASEICGGDLSDGKSVHIRPKDSHDERSGRGDE